MSETVSQRVDRGDAELITAVRAGDTASYGELFERHRGAALRLARQLIPGAESEDLVSEAFTKVLIQLQGGRGPDLAFRAYLLTAIRRLHVDRIRSTARVRTTDDESELDQHVEFFDAAAANFERGTAVDAFASLPERWQLVLWHLDVEGQKPAEVAPLLGMSANSVSALAYRAREGLRQAYLQHHLADTASGDCRWTTERLGAHVRKGLSNRDAGRVDEHLDGCRRCMGIYLELIEVNSNLSGILAPAVLGAAATGYLASASAAATAAGAGAGAEAGVKGLVSNGMRVAAESVKAAVSGMGIQGAAAVVVVAALAGTGVYGATVGFGNHDSADVKKAIKATHTAPSLPTKPPGSSPAPSGVSSDGSSDVPPTGLAVGLTPLAFLPAPGPEPTPPVAVPPQEDPPLPPPTDDHGTPTDPVPTDTPTDTPTDPVPTDTPTDPVPTDPVPTDPVPTDTPTDPVPTDPVPTVGKADFAFAGAVTSKNTEIRFQREITVPVSIVAPGATAERTRALAADRPVITVKIAFDDAVRFDGVVAKDWECGPEPQTDVSTMTCTLTQPEGDIPALVFRATGLPPNGDIRATFTVTASDNNDPDQKNDIARYVAEAWPTAATDLGIGVITVGTGIFERRVTIPVTSATKGDGKDLVLTVKVDFDNPVLFPRVFGSDWECGKLGTTITSMTCTRPQSGPKVPDLVFQAIPLRQKVAATVTISAADNKDPEPKNDTGTFGLEFLASDR